MEFVNAVDLASCFLSELVSWWQKYILLPLKTWLIYQNFRSFFIRENPFDPLNPRSILVAALGIIQDYHLIQPVY